MKPHRYEFGTRPWPEGHGVLQVYAPVDLDANPELAKLIGRCRDVVRGAPLTEVPDSLLHVTLDVVADRTEDLVPQTERDELSTALRHRLAGVPAYRGSAGSALAYGVGVMLDISPARPLVVLQAAVRGVLRAVRGDAACTWWQPKPHISTHFCRTPTESDPWQRRLRAIDPNHAPLRITEVLLVDVTPDVDTNTFGWSPVGSPIPLGRVAEGE